MNVGVTVLALRSYIAEHRFYVTLRARDRGMHAPKRILGLTVVKFGNGADRLPCGWSMAILAGYVQIAVWTVGS